MNKTIIAMAIATFSVSALACGPKGCPSPGTSSSQAGVIGGNLITSGSSASASSRGNGSSHSFAHNTTSAFTEVNAASRNSVTRNLNNGVCTTTLSGMASVSGTVATESTSVAWNYSTGTGTGKAAANGFAVAGVYGNGEFSFGNRHGSGSGFVDGYAVSFTANSVEAGRNEGAWVNSGNISTFEATSSAVLTQYADGKIGRNGCIRCDAPTADLKVGETTAVATSESWHNRGRVDGLKNRADITNKNDGFANAAAFNTAVNVVHEGAKVSIPE